MPRGRVQIGRHKRKNNPIYRAWNGMMHRCYSEHRQDYRHYGGRGIKVDSRWHDFDSFADDMAASYQSQQWCDEFRINRTTVNSRIHILGISDFDLIFSKIKLPRDARKRFGRIDYEEMETRRVVD